MTAPYLSSITVDDVIDALATFLTPFAPGAEIVRAQVNRVAMPSDPCIILTELLQADLMVPVIEFQKDSDTATIEGGKRFDIQVDFYGSAAGEWCAVVKSVFRSFWGYDNFPDNIKPLYTSDGIQSPLISGEEQYESRWTLTVSLEYTPIVTVPQFFAIHLGPVQLHEVT
jgi:hypothetical protein